LAKVPAAAFDIPIQDLGLSTRVFNHLEKAEIENAGQIMERLIDGDEGLLAVDGIGPKGLSEIKTQVSATVPAVTEEPEPELAVEVEPEADLVTEPEPALEEAEVVTEMVAEEPAVEEAAEVVTEAEAVEEELDVALADVGTEAATEAAVEPEAVEAPEPEMDEAQRQAEREKALAAIPADAYDLPLAVLALNSRVLSCLRDARVENLGQIMELLAEGDEKLLAIDGIDSRGLEEIKMQVEIMVSVPSSEPKDKAGEEAGGKPEESRFPRFEYVADDDLDKISEPRRRRRQRQRRPVYEDDWDEIED
jgi:DNA-directed RNA polymerase alpha subunit